MILFSIVLQSLLVAYYLFSGTAKIIGAKYWAEIFAHLGLSQRFSRRYRHRSISRSCRAHRWLLVWLGNRLGRGMAWYHDAGRMLRAP